MSWKIDIVEGLDASFRYLSFKAHLQYFVYQFYEWHVNAFTIKMVKIPVDLMETDKMKVGS